MKIKLTASQEHLIRRNGKEINLTDVEKEFKTMYHFPWWFRPIDGTDEWEMVLFEDLPHNVKVKIEE